MITYKIDGWAALEEWFGFSPKFHDAEVISVDLRREPEPSVIRVHAWRTNSDLDTNGYYRTDRHATVAFEVNGISEMQLDGWNRQNVLYEMWIAAAEEGCEVHMTTSYGVEGKIVAKSVKVSLEPRNASEAGNAPKADLRRPSHANHPHRPRAT